MEKPLSPAHTVLTLRKVPSCLASPLPFFGRCTYSLLLRMLLARFRAISRNEHEFLRNLFFQHLQFFNHHFFYHQQRRGHD